MFTVWLRLLAVLCLCVKNMWVVIIGSYLLGSIPFAYLLARWKTGRDIRLLGSGNVGATNVLRTAGKTIGFLTLLLDVAKGAAAVLLGNHFANAGPLAAFCAMLGHAYPIFLRFRGGKSVATGAGAFLMLSPLGILTSIGIFILLATTIRIVSLSSIIASGLFPLFAWIYGAERDTVIWSAICAALIIFRHRPNIQRLIRGTERRIGESKNV